MTGKTYEQVVIINSPSVKKILNIFDEPKITLV